jgi:hypothetical protein
VEALTASTPGNVNGTLALGVPSKAFPASTVPEMYASLGTAIIPGNTIDKRVLAPGYNPWGATNADGVYVVRTTSDLTIKNTRICGTLVVICPGHKVTLDGRVLLQPARSDFPALIVNGNLALNYSSTSTTLSESDQSTNYNPAGAPYLGVADSDTADQYPSEIQGLVHVTGTLDFSKDSLVRGVVICESAASSDAVECHDSAEIVYDSRLYLNSDYIPQGYTTAVPMVPKAGSWQQGVN